MSRHNERKPLAVADEAARTRKLLDKNETPKFSGLTKSEHKLQPNVNKFLGEHAVVVIITEEKSQQFTISRPIGDTDLDKEQDWVINRTEFIQSMLKNLGNPDSGALNQRRAKYRTELAVEASLLVKREVGARNEYYYPDRVDFTRNQLLDAAEQHMKEIRARIKHELDTAPAEDKPALQAELKRKGDRVEYLDEDAQQAEENLRRFWSNPDVLALIEDEYPDTHRTLGGAFNDEPQVSVAFGRGKTLQEVTNTIARNISDGFHGPTAVSNTVETTGPPTVLESSTLEKPPTKPGSKNPGVVKTKPNKQTVIGSVVALLTRKPGKKGDKPATTLLELLPGPDPSKPLEDA
jgi:hypothetical protein